MVSPWLHLQVVRHWPFLLFALSISAIRFGIALNLPLHPDEAYYWMWSRYPDLSYYDQGPGIAWYIAAFTAMAGNTLPALKLAAVFAATASMVLLYAAALRTGLKERQSLIVCVLYVLLPGIWGGSLLILHDSLLLLFWNAALLSSLQLLDRLKENQNAVVPLFLLSVFIAFGILTKHTMLFFPLGLLLWWMLSGRYGFLLSRLQFYAALLPGGVILLPVLIWNVKHEFAGIEAILFLRSSGAGMNNAGSTGRFLVSQLLAISPVPVILLCFHSFRIFRTFSIKQRRGWLEKCRSFPESLTLIFALTVTVFGFFLIFSFQRAVQGNWTFPAYGGLCVLAVHAYLRTEGRIQKYLRPAFLITSLPLVGLTLPASVLSEPVASQIPYSLSSERRLGGIRESLDEIQKFQKEAAPTSMLLATRYQDAASASFYLDGQPYIPSTNIFMKNQYSFWPAPQKGQDYVVFLIEGAHCTGRPDTLGQSLRFMFDHIRAESSGSITVNGRIASYWKAYAGQGFRGLPDDQIATFMREKMIFIFMPSLLEHSTARKGVDEHISQWLPAIMQEFHRKSGCDEF